MSIFVDSNKKDQIDVILIGGTGAGKRTLAEAVLGENSVTEIEYKYPRERKFTYKIWKTIDVDLGYTDTEAVIKSLDKEISEKTSSGEAQNFVIWYCINSKTGRYQGGELNFIKKLATFGVPFFLVLTQSIGDAEELLNFEKKIEETNRMQNIEVYDVVKVLAKDYKVRGLPDIKSFGINYGKNSFDLFNLYNLIDMTSKSIWMRTDPSYQSLSSPLLLFLKRK